MSSNAQPERRKRNSGPTTSIVQGYETMGRLGRRRLMWIGIVMLTMGGGVGLFAQFSFGVLELC